MFNHHNTEALDTVFISGFKPEIPAQRKASEQDRHGSMQQQSRLRVEELESRCGPSALSMAGVAADVAAPVHHPSAQHIQIPLGGFTHDLHGVQAMVSGLVNEWEVSGLSIEERNAIDALHAQLGTDADLFHNIDPLAISTGSPKLRIPHGLGDSQESSSADAEKETEVTDPQDSLIK